MRVLIFQLPGNMVFETRRLLIRELIKDDQPGFYDLHRNMNVMRFTSGKVQTYAESMDELNHVISTYSRPGNTFRVWAVILRNSLEFIGTTAIILNKENENEIGYRIREKHWGKGYGREVAEGLISYAFDKLGLDNLYGVADVKNVASIRILEKTMDFEDEFYNPEYDCIDRAYRRGRMNNG